MLLFCRPAADLVNEHDLSDVLCEFDAVMEDFTSPVEKRHFRYDEHLKTAKRRSSASVSDSGISDSDSETSTMSLFCRISPNLLLRGAAPPSSSEEHPELKLCSQNILHSCKVGLQNGDQVL